MKRKYNLYQVDSFTKKKFMGNPAGVITNADGLTSLEMQQIARELNNSETAFIFEENGNNYDMQVRFFTPTHEVPICGHATIAAHYARALEKSLKTSRVYQKTGAGILPVDIIKEGNDYSIVMTQGKIEFGEYLEGELLEKLFSALHIRKEDWMENCPIQIVSTGHSKVMFCIKSVDLLHQLQPNMEQLIKISKTINCNGFYVFTMEPNQKEPLIHGRMFAPAIGINEDPVTGNANGPLGAYLAHHKIISSNHDFSFLAVQGEAINRKGTIEVQVTVRDNEPQEVKIKGNAVIAFATEIIVN